MASYAGVVPCLRVSRKSLKELAVTLDADISGEDWVLSAGQTGQLDTGCNEFLIEGFLPANVAILFGSQGGLGKTLLLNALVHALAIGTEWGGYPIPKQRNILFIQTDESESNTQERWEQRGLSELDNVWIIRTFVPAQLNRLKRTIEDLSIDVVVLDSLTSVQMNSGISYKDPEYGRLIYEFKNLASELRVTPIIIVHTKPIKVNGPMTWRRLPVVMPSGQRRQKRLFCRHTIKRSKFQNGDYAGKPGNFLPLPAVETKDLEQQQARLTPTQRECLYARAPQKDHHINGKVLIGVEINHGLRRLG
ncbi:MAG: AAA family ATPase [Cyanobacteria bacterium P01_F01_bin.13]